MSQQDDKSTAAPITTSEPAVIRMAFFSDHKKVVRYQAVESDALITNAYVDKRFAEKMPKQIIVTVAPA